MQVKKYFLLIGIFFMFSYCLIAEEPKHTAQTEHKKNITFYAGINPLALIAFLPNGIGIFGTGFGVISNQEFGISLYGGMNFEKAHSLEVRFSTGPSSVVIWEFCRHYMV